MRIAALFDREGFEAGPFALTTDGKVYSSDGECIINLGLIEPGDMLAFREISRDGHRILLNGWRNREFQLIDLWRRSARRVPSLPGCAPHGVLKPLVAPPTRNLRVHFDQISIAPGEELRLRSVKGSWHKVSLVGKELRLTPVPKGTPEPPFTAKFEPVSIPAEFNFRLKMAAWPDGSRAWLDSRGLLHLKRGHSSNPEVCLVLADGPMAAWSSDGKICGPDFFLHKPAIADAATLLMRIELFCPIP